MQKSLLPQKLNYADYSTNFQSSYRSIQNLDVLSNGDSDFVKTKIKDAALSCFSFCNLNIPQNLSDEELKAFEKLSINNNFIVQKEDKVNSVVLLHRNVYINHNENILKNKTKCEKIERKTRTLNFQVNHEKCFDEEFKIVLEVNNIKKLKQLDLGLLFYMAFVMFTEQLLMFLHFLNLYCLQYKIAVCYAIYKLPSYIIATFLVLTLSYQTINKDFFICRRNC